MYVHIIFSQGDLTAIIELPLGRYEYKFVVDGQWVHDPNEVSFLFCIN